MSQTKAAANPSPTRQIHVSPETYRALRHIAVDREVPLKDVSEEVISAGLSTIRQGQSASPVGSN
jgi:hypothetical protein